MLVLIAPEKDVTREHAILNELFEHGLDVFHLRKPKASVSDTRDYLNQIDPKNYKNVVLHLHHELVSEYNLKGFHFQENHRLKIDSSLYKLVEEYKSQNYTVSSSFHEMEELRTCKADFNYHLLSPVFTSISKEDYKGRNFNVSHIQKCIIGMGGITEQTTSAALALGYQGVGVLGGVWNQTDALKSFKKIKKKLDA